MTSCRHLLTATMAAAALSTAGIVYAQPAARAPVDQAAPAAAPAPATAAAPAATPALASAPAAASGRISAPPPGKGQVVFFRPSRFVGMAISFSVHEGDTGIGKLGNNSYFTLIGDPGPHTFTIQSEATDALHLEIEAGETQFVQETIGVGIVAARPHLTPSDQATFDAMPNLKLSDKKPTDLKPSAAK